MPENEIDNVVSWVDDYYKNIIKNSKINGVSFSYYKSLRGYFKHSILLTDIKQQEFGLVDYKIWERILTETKASNNPMQSGCVKFKYEYFKDICSSSSFYKTKQKFLRLDLLLPTPYRGYYILNPRYIIKLYNPKVKLAEED